MKNCWPIQHGQFQNECVEIENPMKSIHIIIMYKNARETFFPAGNSHHSLRLFLFFVIWKEIEIFSLLSISFFELHSQVELMQLYTFTKTNHTWFCR